MRVDSVLSEWKAVRMQQKLSETEAVKCGGGEIVPNIFSPPLDFQNTFVLAIFIENMVLSTSNVFFLHFH